MKAVILFVSQPFLPKDPETDQTTACTAAMAWPRVGGGLASALSLSAQPQLPGPRPSFDHFAVLRAERNRGEPAGPQNRLEVRTYSTYPYPSRRGISIPSIIARWSV